MAWAWLTQYSLDNANYGKTQGMANYVRKWISQGIPIDGIGKNHSHVWSIKASLLTAFRVPDAPWVTPQPACLGCVVLTLDHVVLADPGALKNKSPCEPIPGNIGTNFHLLH